MSAVRSSCVMVRSWLTFLVLSLAGLWCHPVPDNGTGTVSPLAQQLGRANDMLLSDDNDNYSSQIIMTEFLRLTRTTLAPSTDSPVTTPARQKAFESDAVETTTGRQLTTTNNQSEETGKSTIQQQTKIRPEPVDEKETVLNEIQPHQMVDGPAVDDGVTVQHTTDFMPVDKQQPQEFVSNSSEMMVTTQRQPTDLLVTFKQVAQQPLGMNKVQQQQMAVSPVQQANLVQTAASNGPQQQSSFPSQNIISQQQQMMRNPSVVQQQTVPNSFMSTPFFRQTPLIHSKVPVTHRLVPLTRKQFYIRGSDGTLFKLIPLSVFKSFMPAPNGIQTKNLSVH